MEYKYLASYVKTDLIFINLVIRCAFKYIIYLKILYGTIFCIINLKYVYFYIMYMCVHKYGVI